MAKGKVGRPRKVGRPKGSKTRKTRKKSTGRTAMQNTLCSTAGRGLKVKRSSSSGRYLATKCKTRKRKK